MGAIGLHVVAGSSTCYVYHMKWVKICVSAHTCFLTHSGISKVFCYSVIPYSDSHTRQGVVHPIGRELAWVDYLKFGYYKPHLLL